MIKKRRVFLAVNLPETLKKRLLKIQESQSELPARWTKKDNFHITLIFIGDLDNDEMLDVCRLVKSVARNYAPFEIDFNKVCFGPLNKDPRMVWVIGESNRNLVEIRSDLEKHIFSFPPIDYNKIDQKTYRPHITLGRIIHKEWKKIEKKPNISEDLVFSVPVNSIDVVQSNLSRSGPEYVVLESGPLRD